LWLAWKEEANTCPNRSNHTTVFGNANECKWLDHNRVSLIGCFRKRAGLLLQMQDAIKKQRGSDIRTNQLSTWQLAMEHHLVTKKKNTSKRLFYWRNRVTGEVKKSQSQSTQRVQEGCY